MPSATAREFQRVERCGIASLHRGIDLGRGHPQAGSVDVEPVEFARRLDQGGVAARRHVIDDGAGRPLDIGGDFAGSVSAVMNMSGNIAAAISTMLLPYLVRGYGWQTPFVVTAALSIVAAFLFLRIDATRRIFPEAAA